jgi:GNAT superfamily N-acetyltransferase
MSYSVRRATEADKPELIGLLAELLEDTDASAHHRWLYETNPHGRALTWVAVNPENELVGCTSFFPRRLVFGTRVFRGALGGDGFVRPAFRRRGIGEALHRASRSDMPELGIEVMFGTPRPLNMTPLQKSGSYNITSLDRYARPLSLRPLGIASPSAEWALSRTPFTLKNAVLDPVVRDDPRVEEVWNGVKDEIGLTTERSAAFYNWRFLEAPSQHQKAFIALSKKKPIAVCALEKVDDTVHIVDLVAQPSRLGEALGAIVRHCRGSRNVSFGMTLPRGARARLWKYGLLRRETGRTLNIVIPEETPSSELFLNPDHWYVTWVESDRDLR